jgi:hypothetical protein
VYGRSTLPALASAGMPSTPVTAKYERHVFASSMSALSVLSGLAPAINGIDFHT